MRPVIGTSETESISKSPIELAFENAEITIDVLLANRTTELDTMLQ